MRYIVKNNVRCQLAGPVSDTDTEITVLKAESPDRNPPEPVPGYRLHLTLIDFQGGPTQYEIVNVTGITDNGSTLTLTVERAQEGTTAQGFTEGWLYLSSTAGLLEFAQEGPEPPAPITSSTTATPGQWLLVDTSTTAITITLPTGTDGDVIRFTDFAGTWAANNVTLTGGSFLDSEGAIQSADFVLDINNFDVTAVFYSGAWRIR